MKNLKETLLQPKLKHYSWDSWVLLALSATICFFTANYIISTLAHYGVYSVMYFNAGSVLSAITYFII